MAAWQNAKFHMLRLSPYFRIVKPESVGVHFVWLHHFPTVSGHIESASALAKTKWLFSWALREATFRAGTNGSSANRLWPSPLPTKLFIKSHSRSCFPASTMRFNEG